MTRRSSVRTGHVTRNFVQNRATIFFKKMLKFKVAAHGTAHIVGRAGKRKTSEKRCGKQVTRVHPRIISPWGPTCRPSQHTWVIQVEGSIPAPPPEGRQLVLLRKKIWKWSPHSDVSHRKIQSSTHKLHFNFFVFLGLKHFIHFRKPVHEKIQWKLDWIEWNQESEGRRVSSWLSPVLPPIDPYLTRWRCITWFIPLWAIDTRRAVSPEIPISFKC